MPDDLHSSTAEDKGPDVAAECGMRRQICRVQIRLHGELACKVGGSETFMRKVLNTSLKRDMTVLVIGIEVETGKASWWVASAKKSEIT